MPPASPTGQVAVPLVEFWGGSADLPALQQLPLALVVLPKRSVLGEGGLLPFSAQSGFVIGLVTST